MAKADYYDTLGLNKDSASKEEIKKAYRKMALKYHPDKNKGDSGSEDKFKEVGEAYSVLSDDNKKARYDRYGHEGMSGAAGGGGFGGFSGFGQGGFDAESIFEQFFRGGRSSGGGRGRRSGVQAGSDLQIPIRLTLEEIYEGITKKIKLKKYKTCESCKGSGAKSPDAMKTCTTCNGAGEVQQVQRSMFGQIVNVVACNACSGTGKIITDKCNSCSGEGRIRGEEIVEVKIPAGVSEGQYLTVRGKGNAGKGQGAPSGDLLVVIREEDHKFFHRDDEDIYYDLKLSISEATLGTEITVPLIIGKIKVKIPAGTQPGKKLLIKGKGIPLVNGYGTGDMIIRINIWIPTKISKDSKKLFEKLNVIEELKPKTSEKGFFDKVMDFFS